jgi:hypothetical protein
MNKFWNQVRNQVRFQVWENVWEQVGDNVEAGELPNAKAIGLSVSFDWATRLSSHRLLYRP